MYVIADRIGIHKSFSALFWGWLESSSLMAAGILRSLLSSNTLTLSEISWAFMWHIRRTNWFGQYCFGTFDF